MLCPLMQLDFTDGTGRYDEAGAARYSDSDLHYGILWADTHLADGITHEPMKRFDLAAFRRWCEKKLARPSRPVTLSPTHHAIVDEDDYEAVIQHVWRLYVPSKTRTRATEYAVAKIDRKNVYLHLWLWKRWGFEPVPVVDHEDGNGLNCTRDNLRDATVGENNRNRGVQRNNTSGFKGVHWASEQQRWRARIAIGGRRVHLGSFDDAIAAARAYDEAARRLHGQFAVLNGA